MPPKTEYDFSHLYEVKLEPHVDLDDHGQEVHYDQYRVFVQGEAPPLLDRPNHRLQVGWISMRAGAKLMRIQALYNFHAPQRSWIDREARRQHGNASTEESDELPPPGMARLPEEVDGT